MILGVDKAILLISLEFTHATATDGAGLGLTEEEEQVSKDAEGSLQEGLLPTKDWPLSLSTIDAGLGKKSDKVVQNM